jgi:hypothetical protein
MSDNGTAVPAGQKRVAYWKIVVLVFAIDFPIALLVFRAVNERMVSSWLALSVGISLGLCTREALRRRRA